MADQAARKLAHELEAHGVSARVSVVPQKGGLSVRVELGVEDAARLRLR